MSSAIANAGVNAQYPSLPDGLDFRARLRAALLAERRGLARIAAAALFGALLGLALPYASRVAIDTALPNASPNLLVVVALSVVLLIAHQAWSRSISGVARIDLGLRLETSALAQIVRALLRSDYRRPIQQNSGWMTTTLSAASSAVRHYVESCITLITQSVFCLAYFLVLANASAPMAALVVAFNLVLAAACVGLGRLEAGHTRALLERTSVQHQLLHVLMLGLASLRASFATDQVGSEWSARVQDASWAKMRSARAVALQTTLKLIGSQVLGLGIMVWAVYECFESRMSVGSMMLFGAAAGNLSSSIMALIGAVVGLGSVRPHFERIDELLASARASRSVDKNPVPSAEDILLEKVWYRYPDAGGWAVENQSRQIQKGEVVRLDSPSGTGKTTLLRLMAGLVAPTRGRVTVFGVDAARARELVLYVPQHCKLFETSIRENLELLSGSNRAEVQRVAELTGLSRMLRALPMGEETLVAAQGQNLSSGQRQLIVLTAAFASSRPVLLLDEATNQIDAETRRACDWGALCQGRTVVYVEHA